MVAVAIGGAAVLGAGASIVSGNKAAKAQKNAADMSVAEQQREYDQSRADLAPWRTTGASALGRLAGLVGLPGGDGTTPASAESQLAATPGYQFTLSQGLQANDRAMASRGLLSSTAATRANTRYATGLADSTYNDYANRLAALAGVGQSATTTTAQLGQQTAQGISSAYQNAGNATASAYANTGAAISNGAQNLASMYLYTQGGYGGFGSSGAFSAPNAYGIAGSDGIY